MIAKLWKKIGLLILIIACIYNVMNKILRKTEPWSTGEKRRAVQSC